MFFGQLNFEIFFNLLELLLDLRTVLNEASSCHVIIIFEVENVLFELGYLRLNLDFLLNDVVKFSLFLHGLQVLDLALVVFDDLFVI
jgi:hypothetical protein